MKETNQTIANRIKRAVDASVPDVLPKLLEQIEETKEFVTMEHIINEENTRPMPRKRWALTALAPLAAVLILVLAGWMAWFRWMPGAVISFDVNPSIEMSVNKKEQVLKVTPANDEAEAVLGDMDLKGVKLDVAVNALIGSMVRQGYISDLKNSILITVDSRDAQAGKDLERRLSSEIGDLLEGFSVSGSIMSQTSRADDRLKSLAEEYGISLGKAALIGHLVESDPAIAYEDVARLSINDLSLLIAARQPALDSVLITGQASSKGYIGPDRATAIALEHAGLSEADIRKLEVELDFEDGRMVYEVEFYRGETEYDYDIDAKSGEIVKFKIKDKSEGKDPVTPPAGSGSYIGSDKAISIALEHAGFTKDSVTRLRTELERENGRMVYEVEFEHGDYEYEYEIDALTGKILDIDIDRLPSSGGVVRPQPTNPAYIGSSTAEDVALKDAGLTRGQVRKLETELEREDGRMIYEVEFEYGDYEYEYEIDAVTGKILDIGIERIKKTGTTTAPGAPSGNLISKDEAISIALRHAGLSRSAVRSLEVEYKEKKKEYEVEFKYGGYEYEYEIDAVTGKILEWEKELD
ncbi:MAG TPA: cell wall protein [Clostridiaceae bacterium]|nr:cell wall protein [Clostridiaceae bacterium]